MKTQKGRKPGKRFSKAVVAALLVAGAVAALAASGLGDRWERGTYGPRFAIRGSRPTHAKITIAALNSASEQAWQDEPLVFWTGHYAKMVRNARAAGATVVAFDVIPEVSGQRFVESLDAAGKADFHPDSDFMEAIQDAGEDALVFADQISSTSVGSGDDKRTIHDVGERRSGALPDEMPARQFLALPEVSQNLAFSDLPASPDDIVYEAFLHVPAADAGAAPLPSFPALIAQHARKAAGAAGGVGEGTLTSSAMLGDTSIPTVYVNYTGRPSPQISAVDLANGTLTAEQKEQLKGAIVLVGRTTAGSNDLHRVPGGAIVAGVEAQAQAVATLIDNRPLRRLSPLGEGVVTLLFGLAVVALISTAGAGRWTQGTVTRELPVLGALMGLVLALAVGLFVRADILFPVIGPLLAITLPYVATLGVRAVEERHQREYINRLFGTRLAMGNYLIEHPEALALGGQSYNAAVLFFDIRDSTGREANAQPEAVIDWLNALFQQIVPIVEQSEKGLVYKFTGDGFLAVFGAPEPGESSAKVAIEAAVAIVRAARGFHWPDGDPIQVGCAVNYGALAAGNVGTDNRPEFTVIGNVVNVAAKIEGLNKATPDSAAANVVVTDAALQAAGMTPEMLPGHLCRAFTASLSHGQDVSVYCLDVTAASAAGGAGAAAAPVTG